jgi:hypothetical protein
MTPRRMRIEEIIAPGGRHPISEMKKPAAAWDRNQGLVQPAEELTSFYEAMPSMAASRPGSPPEKSESSEGASADGDAFVPDDDTCGRLALSRFR